MVSFCENYHVNLEKYTEYSGRVQRFSSDQINARIDRLNGMVLEENGRIVSPFTRYPATPHFSNATFRMKMKTTCFGTRYSKPQQNANRLYDGIHPNEVARLRMVKSIMTSINKDYGNMQL